MCQIGDKVFIICLCVFFQATAWWVLRAIVWFSSALHQSAALFPCLLLNIQLTLIPRFLFHLSSPFSSFSLRGTAELFIKQTSSLRLIDFWPTCVILNDQLSVVLLPALPHLCHYSFQWLNLSAQTYSALSSLSSDKIYVGIPYRLPSLQSHRRSFSLVI